MATSLYISATRCCAGLLVFLFPALLPAQKYPAATIKPGLYKNAYAVLRNSETVFRVENTQDATLEQTVVYTILSEPGNKWATFSGMEDTYNKIKSMEGRVYDANGILIRETDKKDIQDFSYSRAHVMEFIQGKVKALNLQQLQFPYTVEFTIKKKISGFLFVPEFDIQALGLSIERATYTFIAPKDYHFKWKGMHTDIKPELMTNNAINTWRWTTQTLPTLPEEDNNPFIEDPYARIVFAPETVQLGDYMGDFSDWKQVGRFFYDLNKDRDNLSPAMQAQVAQIVSGLKTNRKKISALYHYLQENYRYVSIQIGVGGWQTFDAAFVEQRKYGDCKALSNYMKGLLKAAGIPAYQALVYAGEDGAPELYDDLPSPRFNHVILYLPEEKCWLECTSDDNPAGYLGAFTADRKVLLLTPEGGKLMRTPALSPTDNTQHSHTDVVLEEDGNAQIQNQVTLNSELDAPYRAYNKEKSKAELEHYITDNAPFSIAKIAALRVEPAADTAETQLHYTVSASNFSTHSGKRIFVPLTKTNSFKRSLPADDNRELDLSLRDVYTLVDTIVFHLPSGYAVENAPPDKKLESEFGRYVLQIEQKDGQVRVVRNIEMRAVDLPAARYEEVRKFFLEVGKADGAQMVLVKK